MTTTIVARYRFTPNTAMQSYDVNILGKIIVDTTVTTLNGIVDDYLSSGRSHHQGSPNCVIIGLDMKLVPTEDELGINTTQLIAAINFCIGRRVLIYHLPYLPYNVLEPFFSDGSNIFVGVKVRDMMQKLKAAYGVGGEARCIELGERAAEVYNRPELRSAELRGLSTTVLGKDFTMMGTGEWENDLLSGAQVMHACVDAFVSRELGQAMVGPLPRVNNYTQFHSN